MVIALYGQSSKGYLKRSFRGAKMRKSNLHIHKTKCRLLFQTAFSISSRHHPKRQINPRLLDAGAFQDGVQPVFLRFAVHDDELAVFQPHFAFFLAFFCV